MANRISCVTTGNVHDSTQCLKLMKIARSYKTNIAYMIGDTAYDSIDIYETLKEEHDIVSVVPYNSVSHPTLLRPPLFSPRTLELFCPFP